MLQPGLGFPLVRRRAREREARGHGSKSRDSSDGLAPLRPRAPPAGHFPALRAASRLLAHSLRSARQKMLSYSPHFVISDPPPFLRRQDA